MTGLLPPLPVTLRPHPGEHLASYLRRLAQANHTAPSVLRVYLSEPPAPNGILRIERLAQVTGRPTHGLARALTGITPPRACPRALSHRERRMAEAEQRYLDQLALYQRIREDAQIAASPASRSPSRTTSVRTWYARSCAARSPPRQVSAPTASPRPPSTRTNS